jgi:MFS family permease
MAAAAATNVADGIRAVALPLLAVALTRDPLLVAGLGVAQTVPGLLVGLPAGVLADRFDRRRLAVVADLVQSLLFAVVVGAVLVDVVSVPLLYLVAFGLGAAETVGDTAMATAVPALVADRQLERANGRLVSVVFVGQQPAAFFVHTQ